MAVSWRLTKSRSLSSNLSGRLWQYLRAQQSEGIGDQLANERARRQIWHFNYFPRGHFDLLRDLLRIVLSAACGTLGLFR